MMEDIKVAEALAEKLTMLGLGYGHVEYKAVFKRGENGKVERYGPTVRVSFLPDAQSIKEYKEIRNKLTRIAHTWRKETSCLGDCLYLKTKVGNIDVSVGISFPKDKIQPIMSELLKCEVVKHVEQRPSYAVTSFACKPK